LYKKWDSLPLILYFESRTLIEAQLCLQDWFALDNHLLKYYAPLYLQVYLFVSSQRVAGCLVAEPIEEAFKVLTCSVDERPKCAAKKNSRPNSTTLQFGEVILQREAMRKVTAVDSLNVLNGNHNGAVVCEEEAVPAPCGIRAIWVTPSNRRKRIASQLLDAAR
jgi:N-acetyltransferase